MKDELISIIVLVYNTEQYITKCLNSILKQTYKNIEIIVVNDGSTDKSLQKIQRIAKRDSRIKVINQENMGTYKSRVVGYKNATGKYVMYVDSDDWIVNDMVEIMYKNLKEYKTDVVKCQGKKLSDNIVYQPKNIINRNVFMDIENLEPQFFDLLYKTNYCNSICKQLIKKSVMKDISTIEEDLNYSEDLACNLKIYKKMKSVLFIPDNLYIYNFNNSYRLRKNNAEQIKKKLYDTIYVYYELYSSVKEFDIKEKKKYKLIASAKFIKKIVILLSQLSSKLSRKKLKELVDEINEDKKVKEIKKNLENEDYINIFIQLKDMNKPTLKCCDLFMNDKIFKLYNYNKRFYNLYRKIKNNKAKN